MLSKEDLQKLEKIVLDSTVGVIEIYTRAYFRSLSSFSPYFWRNTDKRP